MVHLQLVVVGDGTVDLSETVVVDSSPDQGCSLGDDPDHKTDPSSFLLRPLGIVQQRPESHQSDN
jgi:hypothetical protein